MLDKHFSFEIDLQDLDKINGVKKTFRSRRNMGTEVVKGIVPRYFIDKLHLNQIHALKSQTIGYGLLVCTKL